MYKWRVKSNYNIVLLNQCLACCILNLLRKSLSSIKFSLTWTTNQFHQENMENRVEREKVKSVLKNWSLKIIQTSLAFLISHHNKNYFFRKYVLLLTTCSSMPPNPALFTLLQSVCHKINAKKEFLPTKKRKNPSFWKFSKQLMSINAFSFWYWRSHLRMLWKSQESKPMAHWTNQFRILPQDTNHNTQIILPWTHYAKP